MLIARFVCYTVLFACGIRPKQFDRAPANLGNWLSGNAAIKLIPNSLCASQKEKIVEGNDATLIKILIGYVFVLRSSYVVLNNFQL